LQRVPGRGRLRGGVAAGAARDRDAGGEAHPRVAHGTPGRSANMTIEARGLAPLLGPSGSGKTTLLRIIAGLEFPDAGRVLFDGEDATERSARERRVGFVFQHYALFRHMTVFENGAFGLRVQPRASRPGKGEIRERVEELLALVQLDGMAE